MATAASRSRKPAPTPARPGQKSGRTSIAAATRVRIPPRSIVPGSAGPAIKLTSPVAAQDPRFQKVMDKLQKSASKSKEHVHPERKAAEALAAAKPPAKEKLGDAQANQVDTMKDAQTKKPEKSSFLALLQAEIAKVVPKNLGETENFMKGEKKAQLKGAVTGNVNQQKEEATSGIKSATDQPPDASKVESNEPTAIPPEGPAPAPPAIGATDAVPAPKPESEVSLQQSKDDAGKKLADAQVTPQQLQEANDPRFSAVLTAKSAVEKQATTAPQQYRANEQKTLSQEAAKAVADEKHGITALQGEHNRAGAAIKLRQQSTKEKDEADRKKVAGDIEKIYNETKQTVENKLASLETDVSTMFDQGADAALKSMTDYIDTRMSKWKYERYLYLGPVIGGARWLKDKLFGLPKDVDIFYEEGRKLFTKQLDDLVVRIANVVETRLKEAKDEITRGQKRISDYVNGLPKNLQAVGKAAEKVMAGRFDELRQGVDAKKNDLAQKLAQRYKDANDKANEKLKAMQEENKGLVTKLAEKLGEVIKILREFKERVAAMLKKGQDTIMLIVAHPINFLKNLLNAIKKGIGQFVDNIWAHLKAGFLAWLFGSLAEAGIEIPSDFSLGSILKLVLQVLGLTYDRIRAKAVKLIGERNVALIEKVWSFLSTLIKGGPAALWEQIKEFLGNLKEMVVNAIQDWVVTTVIKAAITKLATMFNPVGAIIQAIMAIYNTVMFFIERIQQILAFVEAVINSVYKIATGDISSAANWIEQALARTIPIIIGFLARLLGLSGISDKIKEIIKKIQDYVDKAVDKLIDKVVKGIGKLFGKGKGEEKGTGDPDHDAKVQAGLLAIDQEDAKLQKDGKIEQADAEKVAAKVKREHPIFKSIMVVDGNESWDYKYEASNGTKKGEKKRVVRPRELVGKATPKLDELEKKEEGVTQRYVYEYKNNYEGDQELLIYVEMRAARKLGRVSEASGIQAYNKATGHSLSKNNRTIEMIRGDEPFRIPDIFLFGVVVGDVKDELRRSYDGQMRDNVLIAKGSRAKIQGKLLTQKHRFDLVVRAPSDKDKGRATIVSGPLKDAIASTGGKVYYLL